MWKKPVLGGCLVQDGTCRKKIFSRMDFSTPQNPILTPSMDSPGEGQQRFWHLAKPSNQCSSATTAAKWGGMWVEDCQRQAPADECGDDCTNPTQTEKSIGGCLGWWGSRGGLWRVMEPIGAISNDLGGKRE